MTQKAVKDFSDKSLKIPFENYEEQQSDEEVSEGKKNPGFTINQNRHAFSLLQRPGAICSILDYYGQLRLTKIRSIL